MADGGPGDDGRPSGVPAAGSTGPDDADLSYEAARDALTEIVGRLEAGNLTLEESLSLWERGESLVEVCQSRLDGARARLEARTAGADTHREEEEQ